MGIADSAFGYMARTIPRLGLGGTCVTLGKQHVHITPDRALEHCVAAGILERAEEKGAFNFPAGHPFLATHAADGVVVKKRELNGMITDVALMNLLGFAGVKSIDVSDFEGADIVMDLNDPDASERLGERFSFVFDGGTIEHVFHLPNALKNIFGLIEVGGCVLHISPSNNCVDHGFYQFSPTFFYDYYAANGFTVVDCQFFYNSRDINKPYGWLKYVPGALDDISFGGLDDLMYGVAFLARKNASSTWDVVPQQSLYARQLKWKSGLDESGAAR